MKKLVFIGILLAGLSSCWPSSVSFIDNGSMPAEWKSFSVKTLSNSAPNTPLSYAANLTEKIKDGIQNNTRLQLNPSAENAEVHIKRIKSFLPGDGKVSILQITDKQYANMLHFIAAGYDAPKPGPQQLEIF